LIRNKPISEAEIASAALFTLDALASAYAGSFTPTGRKLIAWAQSGDLDDKRRAFLMGALTHITETDDLHRASVTHPGCVVVPAALSLGEKTGASADKILIAILHGFEAMCRIGAAVGPTHYKVWHNTATCGPYGSAMDHYQLPNEYAANLPIWHLELTCYCHHCPHRYPFYF
jgi:2-methylcitrate dehydratase PrpD